MPGPSFGFARVTNSPNDCQTSPACAIRKASRHSSSLPSARSISRGCGRIRDTRFRYVCPSAATCRSACAKASVAIRRRVSGAETRGVVQQGRPDLAENAGRIGKPARDIERRRHRHHAACVDAAMRRTKAVKPVEGGGNADRSSGIAAKREIARVGAASGSRPARRSARKPAGRAQICRRAVMNVDASEAIEKFVADRLAHNRRTGTENAFDGCGMTNRRLLIR